MENNLINKINENLIKIMKLLVIDNTSINEIENLNNICISLIIFFFSKFKYNFNNNKINSEIIIQFINDTLKLSNSKFILPIKDRLEFINFILFFFVEFDIVNSYIEHLAKINKKYINVNIENLLESEHIHYDDNNFDINNFLQEFHKLNFTLKNIKKQIDSFINLSYKLNEIKKDQNIPINNLKIEEFILLNENIFKMYKKSIGNLQIYLETKFNNVNQILNLLDESIINYQQIKINDNISNLNKNYDHNIKNIQIEKIKKIFKLGIIEIVNNEKENNLLLNWIQNLEEKLSTKLSKIKSEQSNLFNNNEISNTLSNLAIQLENFLNDHTKDINHLCQSQFEDNNILTEIKSNFKNFNFDNNLDIFYENQLIIKDLKNLKIVYDYYIKKFEEINKEIISKIQIKFDLYNLKSD